MGRLTQRCPVATATLSTADQDSDKRDFRQQCAELLSDVDVLRNLSSGPTAAIRTCNIDSGNVQKFNIQI